MSIVNVFMSPDLALVGVDTEGLLPDGSHLEGCKMIFLPHLSAVVAFRGLDAVLACASPSIVGFSKGFDELAEMMEEILTGSRKLTMSHFGIPDTEPANFFLVGYSPKSGRMVGHAFGSKPGSLEVEKLMDFPSLYAPGFGADVSRGWNVKFDRASMIRVAMDQCRRTREQNENWPAGGRLFITEIRKGSISVEHVCDFPSRDTV